jgi:signal transduction histidine kinase
MKRSKRVLTLVLMISSIMLLVALQFFWLRSSYEKAFFDLRRESSVVLRTTLFNIRDSLFIKNIEPVKEDSAKILMSQISPIDSVTMKILGGERGLRKMKGREHASKVQVFISSNRADTTRDFLKPLASTIHEFRGQQSFFIRVGPDTLNRDTLSLHYQQALYESNIVLPFHIRHISNVNVRMTRRFGLSDEPDNSDGITRPKPFSDTLETDRVHLNPGHAYAALFPDMRASIFKEIAPQILFSFFLTFIISLSFVLMYRSIRTQQRLMELKNDFISNVTHELKTPVATVSVALEALKDFHALNNPERTREYLSIAQSELNRLTLMTDKILKASVFENNGVTFFPEKIDLDLIIKQVLSSMRLVFEKKKLVIDYAAHGQDFDLQGSEVHLTNVIYNLVDNAFKYSREETTIAITLSKKEDIIRFAIQDQGVGIKKEYHKKIFEKFFRVPTGDVHNVKGYGLGLNYVASVVKGHAGTIQVDSEYGKGSCFIITLPEKHGKD